MSSEHLLQQMCRLRESGIYVGFQTSEAGLYVWMTDYRVRVDQLIKEKSLDAASAILSTWLDSPAVLGVPRRALPSHSARAAAAIATMGGPKNFGDKTTLQTNGLRGRRGGGRMEDVGR
jgi:hypothetical protein